MFSPILATRATRASSNCACSSSTVAFEARAAAATSSANAVKLPSLATKSVWQLTSRRTATPFSSLLMIAP
jgi:hypothetical protein